jgi:hypothetical protein
MSHDEFSAGPIRLMAQLATGLERNGYTRDDVNRLSSGNLLARLLPFVRGEVDPGQMVALAASFKRGGGTEADLARLLSVIRGNAEVVPIRHTVDLDADPYRRRGGSSCVRCLCWGGGGWSWGCSWLGGGWGGHDPAAARAAS